MEAPRILPAWGRHPRREGIHGDLGRVVDGLGQRGRILRRREARLASAGLATQLPHALPLAPAGREARLSQTALGLLPFPGGATVARFGEERTQQLSGAKQVEVAEEGIAVGGSR